MHIDIEAMLLVISEFTTCIDGILPPSFRYVRATMLLNLNLITFFESCRLSLYKEELITECYCLLDNQEVREAPQVFSWNEVSIFMLIL